jgi:8-oxo-dGTP pyrophosphatase MutT (NUDIX family)
MSRPGAGIIVYFTDGKGTFVLLGKESKHLTDVDGLFPPGYVKSYETFPGTDITAANAYFSRSADQLEQQIRGDNIRRANFARISSLELIKYDTPIVGIDTISVHYRFLPKNFKRGIVKGGMEPQDSGNPLNTIIREFDEEVGVRLTLDGLSPYKTVGEYIIYFHEIKSSTETGLRAKVKMFNDTIVARYSKRKGELYDLAFKSVKDIIAGGEAIIQHNGLYLTGYNVKSQVILDFFNLRGQNGGRKHKRGYISHKYKRGGRILSRTCKRGGRILK